MSYYKGLDENLCGRNGFQYEVGKEFTADTDDTWYWLHFAKKVTDAILYGHRIVEVEPVTKIKTYRHSSGVNAKTIRIVRELSRDEIIEKLGKENCPISMMKNLKPSYNELMQLKDNIKRRDYTTICCDFTWLTEEQKLNLLPKSWAERVHMMSSHS